MKKIIAISIPIITFVAGLVISPLLQRPIEHAIDKYYNKELITYEVISTSQMTIQELQDYANSERLTSFNLNLDDPILAQYYITKLKLKNRGIAIRDRLKLHALIGKEFVKILDIKYNIITPVLKKMEISNSMPDLKLLFRARDNIEDGYTFIWDLPGGTEIAGFNIYRSKFKYVGYGKVNENLIKTPYFRFRSQEKDFFPAYYTVEAVGLHGLRSELANSVPLPESDAFRALSYDVNLIQSSSLSKKLRLKSRISIYKSLKQAIEKKGKGSIFFINEYRNEATNSDESVDDGKTGARVLYLDDFNFLKGSAEIYLNSGLDEDAEIIFYFLYKNLVESGHDMKLTLEGKPEIEFNNISTSIKYNFNVEKEINNINKKYLLTPSIVTTYLGNHNIYIMWALPKDKAYKGVRIFRNAISSETKLDDPGKEIYDGAGSTREIICFNKLPNGIRKENSEIHSSKYMSDEPPPRIVEKVKRGAAPGAPRLNIESEDGFQGAYSEVGKQMPFFADNQASSHASYKYTLYAYDDKGNYSYPIIIEASLRDLSAGIICEVEEE